MGYGLATGDADAILMGDEMLTFDDGSPTGARFEGGKPPARVLDLGCGVWAMWILKALRCWPETEFVGELQPPAWAIECGLLAADHVTRPRAQAST